MKLLIILTLLTLLFSCRPKVEVTRISYDLTFRAYMCKHSKGGMIEEPGYIRVYPNSMVVIGLQHMEIKLFHIKKYEENEQYTFITASRRINSNNSVDISVSIEKYYAVVIITNTGNYPNVDIEKILIQR